MKKYYTILLATLFSFSILAQAPKKVIIEEHTGTWCGFCPKAALAMKDALAFHPNAIGIAMHKSDPMANSYTNAISSGFGITSYPSGGVDRFAFSNPSYATTGYTEWKFRTTTRLNTPTPVAVNFISNYNYSTRALNVTVYADFVGAASGDIRINCVLVEDSVITTNSPQKNYYGQGCSSPDPNSVLYNLPCSISNYVHAHVARRNLANDPWGTAGIIPSTVTNGQKYSITYTDTIPSSWNVSNMHIVAFVSKYGTNMNEREIMNSIDGHLGNTTTAIEENLTIDAIEVKQNAPNPFSDITAIQFRLNATENVAIKIYNVLGKEVNTLYAGKLVPGDHTFYWNGLDINEDAVSSGVYYYRITTSSQQVSKPMIFLGRN